MISIVICSRIKELDSNLRRNIEETVGCEYELNVIDNSDGKHSLFEAYNLGIEMSKGQIICFIHDDIYIHTKDWGKYVISCFEKSPDLGLLGVAGAKIKTKMPSAWWDCSEKYKVINIIQHKDGKKNLRFTGFKESSTEEVAVIDGVFMAMRRSDNFLFNENIYGFHNYDLNLSIEKVLKGYQTFVTKDILLEHFSSGTINRNWYKTTVELHEIYKKYLPLNKANVSKKELKRLEMRNGKKIITDLYGCGDKKKALDIWKKLILLEPVSRIHFKLLRLFITN